MTKSKQVDEVKIGESDLKILKLVEKGKTSVEIAERVGINKKAVEYRLIVLRNQLKCNNVTQLVAMLIRKGVL